MGNFRNLFIFLLQNYICKKRAEHYWPPLEKLDYWKKVLAVPVARPAGPGSGGDMRKDILWFEMNADNYKGKWVALKDGVLIGSHESRAELRISLKQSGRLFGTTFFRL